MKIISYLVLGFTVATLNLLTSCTGARYASTSMGQAITKPVSIKTDWGEVFCGDGRVCAEVEVLRVDTEMRDGGRVEVRLHNRTSSSVAVQIAIEILTADGVRLDSTNFQDAPVAPRQEKVWEMPGIYRKDAKIKVMLRKR